MDGGGLLITGRGLTRGRFFLWGGAGWPGIPFSRRVSFFERDRCHGY